MMEEEQPFAWAWKLHDAAARWLQPGQSEGPHARESAGAVHGKGLSADTSRWVHCYQSVSVEAVVPFAGSQSGGAREGKTATRDTGSSDSSEAMGSGNCSGGVCPTPHPTNPFLPVEGSTNTGAGMLEMRAAGTPEAVLPTDGGGADVPRCWRSGTLRGLGGMYSIPVRT